MGFPCHSTMLRDEAAALGDIATVAFRGSVRGSCLENCCGIHRAPPVTVQGSSRPCAWCRACGDRKLSRQAGHPSSFVGGFVRLFDFFAKIVGCDWRRENDGWVRARDRPCENDEGARERDRAWWLCGVGYSVMREWRSCGDNHAKWHDLSVEGSTRWCGNDDRGRDQWCENYVARSGGLGISFILDDTYHASTSRSALDAAFHIPSGNLLERRWNQHSVILSYLFSWHILHCASNQRPSICSRMLGDMLIDTMKFHVRMFCTPASS